jgi:hypothetical protein
MEEIETWHTTLRKMVGAISLLRVRLDDLEEHIEGLDRGALRTPEDLIADGKSRLLAMKSHAPPKRVCASHSTTRRELAAAKTANEPAPLADRGFDDLGAVAEQSQKCAFATLQRVSECIDEAEGTVVRAVLIGMETDTLGRQDSTAEQG